MRTILSYDTPMDMISSGPDALSLADLAVDAEARVTALVSAHGAPLGRLADLGFVPGEYVSIRDDAGAMHSFVVHQVEG